MSMAEENKPSKPGEAALENMKLLKSESAVFKVPKVPKQKVEKKSQVLDEDDYVESIAKIIQRDFFPDLEKLKAQNDYLEATENKDYARLAALTRKYSGSRPPTEPYNSPATFDTPGVDRPYSPSAPTVREQRPSSEQPTVDKPKDITENHTLDSFLASHTSEDNASYSRVINLEDKKRAQKLAPQLEAEVTSAIQAEACLALPSIEQQADQSERPDELATWRYTARNHIMYVPDGAKSQKPPPKPNLQHHNTRLKAEPFDHRSSTQAIHEMAKNHNATVSGKIGVDGVSVTSDKRTPQYPYVATPSPRPGDGPDQSPLMTWGEIEGTPFRLDGGDTPLPAIGAGAAYKMLEGGVRERIALQLAEQVAKRRRPTTPRIAPTTPSFRTNTERFESMSPAARKLATKHLLSPKIKLTPNTIGIFSYAATPKRTPTPGRSIVATSSKRAGTPLRSNVNVENNLTDNLLQINVAKRSRLKAQDFFQS